MTHKEFYDRLFEILKTSHGKKIMTRTDNDFRGLFVIMFEIKDGNNTPSGLAKKLNITTARIARALNTLENKGYIERNNDDNDKRKTYIKLTNIGEEKLDKEKKCRDKFLENIIKGLSDDELESFINIFEKMAKNIFEFEGCDINA